MKWRRYWLGLNRIETLPTWVQSIVSSFQEDKPNILLVVGTLGLLDGYLKHYEEIFLQIKLPPLKEWGVKIKEQVFSIT